MINIFRNIFNYFKSKQKQYSEFELINKIQSWTNQNLSENILGIGDDTSVIKNFINDKNKNFLISIDTLVEGTHFTKNTTNFFELGWKSLAVNISDIAAMGGIPLYVLISFSAPKNLKKDNFYDFYQGFEKLANLTNIKLIGGDTVKSKLISITITILGKTEHYFTRNAAINNDIVCTTGTFGDAAFGLKTLLKNKKKNYFTNKFNMPIPRFLEANFLGKNNLANAMMDVSDGLAFTLHTISEKSKIGILIYENKIPINKELKKEKNYLDFALFGGEDYELVFTTKEKNLEQILKNLQNISIIGKTSDEFRGVKILTKDNKTKNLKNKGYEAF